jgi:hypothetical protein
MDPELLDRFARLLTSDTDACAALFASDAVYSAHLGGCELRLVGRAEIRQFLSHVPRQIAFRAEAPQARGEDWVGEITVQAHDLAPRPQRVRFAVRDGRFQRFEQLA